MSMMILVLYVFLCLPAMALRLHAPNVPTSDAMETDITNFDLTRADLLRAGQAETEGRLHVCADGQLEIIADTSDYSFPRNEIIAGEVDNNSFEARKTKRSLYLHLAHLAESVERWDEMCVYVEGLCHLALAEDSPMKFLSNHERRVLYLAFKNAVGNCRKSLKLLHQIKNHEKAQGVLIANRPATEVVDNYSFPIKHEFTKLSLRIQSLLQLLLDISQDDPAESKLFYKKLQGDHWRYQAEIAIASGEAFSIYADRAQAAYESGLLDIAEKFLAPANPLRLGLVLNLAVFYYEISGDAQKAINLSKCAFQDAVNVLDGVSEDRFQAVSKMLYVLRENFRIWFEKFQDLRFFTNWMQNVVQLILYVILVNYVASGRATRNKTFSLCQSLIHSRGRPVAP